MSEEGVFASLFSAIAEFFLEKHFFSKKCWLRLVQEDWTRLLYKIGFSNAKVC